MSNRFSRTARGVFAALVASGLTFGAASASAAPNAGRRCPIDLEHGYIGVACSVNQHCETPCNEFSGSWNPGVCQDGCCNCAI